MSLSPSSCASAGVARARHPSGSRGRPAPRHSSPPIWSAGVRRSPSSRLHGRWRDGAARASWWWRVSLAIGKTRLCEEFLRRRGTGGGARLGPARARRGIRQAARAGHGVTPAAPRCARAFARPRCRRRGGAGRHWRRISPGSRERFPHRPRRSMRPRPASPKRWSKLSRRSPCRGSPTLVLVDDLPQSDEASRRVLTASWSGYPRRRS